MKKLLLLTLAMVLALTVGSVSAATMSASLTAPVVDAKDIANYGTMTSLDKWWNDSATSGYPKGQTFTVGSTGVMLKAISYQVGPDHNAEPTKTYVIRVGTVDVGAATFSEIHSESATQNFSWNSGEFMTWTFDTPIYLAPNTEYGIDIGMTTSTTGYTTGMPYLQFGADEYAGGTRYMSGTTGGGIGDTTLNNISGDRIFHIDMEDPMAPSPQDGQIVTGGNVGLSWTNTAPNVGNDVWVDVWFGTDPGSMTKVVDAGLNTTSTAVNAPVADTYYWRVDSYLEGVSTGTPVEGNVFTFIVDDTDGDGLPDSYELLYTSPSSNVSMDPAVDEESDGLTNLQEYQLGTNPIVFDTDGDTLGDGDEIAGAGLRPATDPLNTDTDGDGIDDGAETNTGTYVSAADTGTNPANPDSDGDGLTDGVETNTGTFVDAANTGTDPLDADTDNDNAEDWYEVAASYTDPTNSGSTPNIPYPLPDPDGSTGSTSSPVKVYIMSGQSNMVGFGTVAGDGPGTLETITITENKFPNVIDGSNNWTVRNDVMYRGVISCIGDDYLKPQFGASSATIGPEFGFGHVMGYYHDEPVILIKSSIGNRSLSWDFAPTSTPRFDYDGYTYAGYGESPNNWLIGESPTPFVWYAGKQWDDCFIDEADMGPKIPWAIGTVFPSGCQIKYNGQIYNCTTEHTASSDDEPGIGAQWSSYWSVYSVFNAVDILDNFATEYPQYAAQGFEIAGFVWWQGHKDGGEVFTGTAGIHAVRYEYNLTNFINDIRDYYETRYPANCVADAPFVVATVGFGGGTWDVGSSADTIFNAQMAVGDPVQHPEFAGTVASVDTTGYWRDPSISPTSTGYHYNHNAETYMLTGDALGRAMVSLLDGDPPADTNPPTPNPATFASAPAADSSSSITMTATTGSDPSGPVEYLFTETSGNPGGTSSTWQTSPTYTDTGLDPSTEYTYTVVMSDTLNNVGSISAPMSATTYAAADTDPPTPNPATFASAPVAISDTAIRMTSTTGSDASGPVEYYFTCTAGGGNDSGWQTSETYTDSGLTPDTQYTYTVKMRDSLGLTGTASGGASATTNSPAAPGMSASLTAPVVDGEDIANYGTITGSDKWWTDVGAEGQTFTTGASAVWANSITYQILDTAKAEPTKNYIVRVGTIYGDVFTEIYSETIVQDFTWNSSEYMTWTLNTPVLLAPNTEYGIDVGLNSSTSGWTTGIPYINTTGNEYGGMRYISGVAPGLGDTTMSNTTGDRIFHVDLDAAAPGIPGYASPQSGATVASGNVDLTWTNLTANSGSDVWVDVWFGTDPGSMTKVVDAGLNATSTTVSAPTDGRYYWQIDSYLDGSSGGSPDQGLLMTFYVNESAEPALISALTGLKNHVLANPTLDAAAIAAHKATIDTNKSLFGSSYDVIAAVIDLVQTYDTTAGFGPLWIGQHPPSRDAFTDDLVSTMYWVQQYMMDYTYNNANLALYEGLLDGFKFDCSAVFPGSVAPPTVTTHTATIDASYPDTAGWDRLGDTLPARKPTGTYLSPGTIATVTVPAALVNCGYMVRVGAHSWDNSYRTPNKRLERSTIEYQIESTQTKVANPLGGGIYIEVPLGADNGIVTVDITGGVRSPYFSAKSFHTTTLSEWQNVERHHPAPWADFQSEKYMCQVPTTWIYALDDPAAGLANWDMAIDTFNDLMGFPRDHGKETIYLQVDVINRSSVFAPGYPAVNVSDSDPTSDEGGNVETHMTYGPNYAIWISNTEIHEQGHAYFFDKFGGESESTVNLPYAAIMNQCFGHDMDYSLAASFNFQGNPHRTLDNTAIAWMCSFNFSPRNVAMHSAEASYQLKGHAKFVDIARLFGWQVLNDFWKGYVDEYEANGVRTSDTDDDKILRLSKCAGVDLRPLLHFWGKHPLDSTALAAAIATEGLSQSAAIYDTLVHYKSILPADNAAFQTYAMNWWGHQPSVNAAWTEVEHARQWDTTSYWQANEWEYMGTDPAQADGEIYTAATRTRTQAYIDSILTLYFPDGRPADDETDPPTPNPASFAIAPAADSDTAISMTATTGSDVSGPVEYLFTETSGNPGGTTSQWQTSPSYTDTGLTASTQYTYTVTMRDSAATPNVGTASAPASATTLAPADTTAPNPDPMTWATPPAPVAVAGGGGGGSIITNSATAPTDDDADISNLGQAMTGTSLVWQDRPAVGQTFTSGTESSTLNALTLQVNGVGLATKTYVVRVGTVSGTTFTEIHSETFTQDFDLNASDYITWTFDSPVALASDTLYGIDVGLTNSTSGWSTGIPALIYTADVYAGGARYSSGSNGIGNSTISTVSSGDMTFQLDISSGGGGGDSETEITMTATTATDDSGVEYYFTETSGNPGGDDSGWQDSPVYTDTGLSPGTQYTYTVTARDKSINQNATAPSAAASATTGGAVVDDPVPNVVGMTQANAEAAITAAGFTVGTITTAYSDTVAAGDVISQNPAAGTPTAAGSPVDLVVSLGVEMVTVPNVVGQPQATAEANIVAAQLVVGNVTTAYSDTVTAGDVISQNPTGGTSVVHDSSVDIVVSLGVQMVTVPDVVGQPQATAEANITAADLTVGTVTTAYSDTVAVGDVISQNPTAGDSVVHDSAVDIVVSLGVEMVTVPSVVGQVQATAEANIVAAKLVVGTVTTAYSDTVALGDVISQNPSGGTSVVHDSAVDIVVSLGVQMVTVPSVVGQAQATAEANIVAAILTVGNVTTAYSDTVAAGDVISQNPTSGSSVVHDSPVDLVVSLGVEPSAIKLAKGVISNVSSSWTTVNLAQSYTSMVVVATPNYDNTSDPAVVRIQNASGSSFDIRVDAAGGTGPSGIDVHYIVVEEGVYTVVQDGVKMEAVKYNSTVTDRKGSWVGQAQSYSNSYSSPVVFGQVMTYNDSRFSTFWCSDGTQNGVYTSSALYTGKMIGEDPDTSRSDETIGYIVIESGSGTLDGVSYVTALGGDTILGVTNSPPYSYSFSGLSSASVAIANQAAMDGNNGGWAALYGSNPVSATSINLAIDEDVANDVERNHISEQVGYIVFE